jgi:hypothetical protein
MRLKCITDNLLTAATWLNVPKGFCLDNALGSVGSVSGGLEGVLAGSEVRHEAFHAAWPAQGGGAEHRAELIFRYYIETVSMHEWNELRYGQS